MPRAINRNAGDGLGAVPQARVAAPLAESTLPTWELLSFPLPGRAAYACPRCGEETIVVNSVWIEGALTRPCTYCYKVSRLPGQQASIHPKGS